MAGASVEIVCVGQAEPTAFANDLFRVVAETKLLSHRGPTPLFQSDFDELRGCIYHFLNLEGGRNANDLLDQWFDGLLKFRVECIASVQQILSTLLDASPDGHILFTSDYQFGGEPKWYKRPVRIGRFWELHESDKLKPNALYRLVKDQ